MINLPEMKRFRSADQKMTTFLFFFKILMLLYMFYLPFQMQNHKRTTTVHLFSDSIIYSQLSVLNLNNNHNTEWQKNSNNHEGTITSMAKS